jgi:hypothetical protein
LVEHLPSDKEYRFKLHSSTPVFLLVELVTLAGHLSSLPGQVYAITNLAFIYLRES